MSTAVKAEQFFCLGCSHRTAPIELREKIFVNDLDLSSRLPLLKEAFSLQEVFALATCNRFEVYGVGTAPLTATEQQLGLFAQLGNLELHQTTPGEASIGDRLRDALYLLTGNDAIRHALSVASSIDSLIVGETQITAQFKKAIEQARRTGTLGPITDRLSQIAFSTAKLVRTKTGISKHPVSISHAAIDLAGKVLETLKGKEILIIGAGEMAEICCRYVIKHNPAKIWIANRTVASAESLWEKLSLTKIDGQGILPGSGVVPLSEVPGLLRHVDLVVSSTAASHLILEAADFKPSWRARAGKSLIMIDIALPRDLDPRLGEFEDVYLFDIDDLKAIVDENSQLRESARQEAIQIITQKVEGAVDWIAKMPRKNAVAELQMQLRDFFQAELRKSRKSGSLKNLEPQAFSNVDESVKLMVQKFVDRIGRHLNQVKTPEEAAAQLQQLQGIFLGLTEAADPAKEKTLEVGEADDDAESQ